MAKINNTSAYAISTPIVGDDIVIGSAGGAQGETKNFKLSDISAYVLGNAVTPTLDDVCQAGASTTTGITVAGTTTLNGAIDANSTADVSGAVTLGSTLGVTGAVTMSAGATINGSGLAVNGSGGIIVTDAAGITSSGGPVSGTALNTSGGLLVSGTSFLGEIDSAGPADIADTLTLSKASGTGLQVDANAKISGDLFVNDIDSNIGSPLTISASGNLAASVNTFARFVFEYGITATSGTSIFDGIRLTNTAPSSASDTGEVGQIAVDSDYIYVCTATDTWKRVAIATW